MSEEYYNGVVVKYNKNGKEMSQEFFTSNQKLKCYDSFTNERTFTIWCDCPVEKSKLLEKIKEIRDE